MEHVNNCNECLQWITSYMMNLHITLLDVISPSPRRKWRFHRDGG